MTVTRIAAALAGALFSAQSAVAAPMILDFDALSSGAVVSGQFAPLVTVSSLSETAKRGQVMAFDTTAPTGGDRDLGGPLTNPFTGETRGFGRSLIISEDNDPTDPDDNARGGGFAFDFAQPVTFNGFDALDIERKNGVALTLFDAAGDEIFRTTNGAQTVGDNKFLAIAAGDGVAGVSRAEVTLKGSGAIDNLRFDAGDPPAAPVPAAMGVLALGLAGFAWARRRRAS